MVETNDLIHTADDDELEIREAIERFRIKADAQYAEKDYLLERDGIGFAPRPAPCQSRAPLPQGSESGIRGTHPSAVPQTSPCRAKSFRPSSQQPPRRRCHEARSRRLSRKRPRLRPRNRHSIMVFIANSHSWSKGM